MGLDMYAFTVPQGSGEDFAVPVEVERTEIAYWRKFNALHGWMEDLFVSRGGEGEFNCVPLQLDPIDIDRLESVIRDGKLEPREGFFFGAQEVFPEDIEATIKFIEDARDAFADGQDVYYDSWW